MLPQPILLTKDTDLPGFNTWKYWDIIDIINISIANSRMCVIDKK